MPQLSVGTSSITTTVVAGFLPSTSWSSRVTPSMSAALSAAVDPLVGYSDVNIGHACLLGNGDRSAADCPGHPGRAVCGANFPVAI